MLHHDYKLTFKCVTQFIIDIFYAAVMLYQNNPLSPTHPSSKSQCNLNRLLPDMFNDFYSLVTNILPLEMVNQWQQISS